MLLLKHNCINISGHVTAACISLQICLQKELLWLACRHHVGEVLLTHVWNALKIETSKSPEVKLFARFRDQFNNIAINKANFCFVSFENDISHIIRQLTTALSSEDCYRGDYKELLILSLVFLTKETESLNIAAPGALHHARWMAKLLYAMKMVLLSKQIPKELGVFAAGQLSKLQRFVRFILLVYVPWWITCTHPADAPVNDLQLLRSIQSYNDEVISTSALKAFRNHLWYLTEELVPLSLFSKLVTTEDKQGMLNKLLSDGMRKSNTQPTRHFQKRYGTSYGKPAFPAIENTSTLDSLVGQDSWGFFHTLKIDVSFLETPVNEWEASEAYKAARNLVAQLKVVNDSAERGVKLGLDFMGTAKIEERYQHVLQVTLK